MTEKTPTDTDNQQADKAADAARDAAARRNLRAARDAGARVVRVAMQDLAKSPAFDAEAAAAPVRTLNGLTLSLGRIVDMDERLARKQTLSTADLDAVRLAIERLLAGDPEQFSAYIAAERAAQARAGAQGGLSVDGAADVEGAGA